MKLIFLLSFMIYAKGALAACGFLLGLPSVNYTVVDPSTVISQNFTLTRDKGGAKCNDFVVGFSRGGSTDYNRIATSAAHGSTISYNLYKTNAATNVLTTRGDSTSINQVITGTIARDETKSLNYFFKLGTLSTTATTRAGTYSDSVLVTASEDDYLSAIPPEVSQPLLINIVVPQMISISLVDSGALHNNSSTSKILDFGELTEGEELGFDVRVVSNAGFTLSVSSANNQFLQLENETNSASNKIGYDFYASNLQRNLTSSLSTPVNISSGVGSTPIQGVSVPIRVIINNVENKNSGIYKDYVTFTVATTE